MKNYTTATLKVILTLIGLLAGAGLALAQEDGEAGNADPADGLLTHEASELKRKSNFNQTTRRNRLSNRRRARQTRQPRRRNRVVRAVPDSDSASLLAEFASGTSDADISRTAEAAGLNVLAIADNQLLGTRIAKLSAGPGGAAGTLSTLQPGGAVQGFQPNYIYELAAAAKAQYAVGRLKLEDVSKIGDGSGVSVAVLDSGVEPGHPAFAGHDIARFDALGDDVRRRDSHGTAVSSIIAARSGMVGIVPNAQLMSARTFAYDRRYRKSIGETFHLLRGLDWAAGNGAKVVNLSFAGPRDPLMERALRAAEEQGIVAVAAAGNRGPRAKPAYPAAYDDVIAVTATDQRDRLYRRSNRGDYIHIAAPGVNIFSASGKKGYRFRSGTSMATAYVSGAAAILLQRKPDLTPADIATRLAATAQDLGVEGRDRQFGHGLLNVLKAAGDD